MNNTDRVLSKLRELGAKNNGIANGNLDDLADELGLSNVAIREVLDTLYFLGEINKPYIEGTQDFSIILK